jgi:hypothetical protein
VISAPRHYVTHALIGRLGNELFQYASVWCLARQNHLTPVFRGIRDLEFLKDPAYKGTVMFNRVND